MFSFGCYFVIKCAIHDSHVIAEDGAAQGRPRCTCLRLKGRPTLFTLKEISLCLGFTNHVHVNP